MLIYIGSTPGTGFQGIKDYEGSIHVITSQDGHVPAALLATKGPVQCHFTSEVEQADPVSAAFLIGSVMAESDDTEIDIASPDDTIIKALVGKTVRNKSGEYIEIKQYGQRKAPARSKRTTTKKATDTTTKKTKSKVKEEKPTGFTPGSMPEPVVETEIVEIEAESKKKKSSRQSKGDAKLKRILRDKGIGNDDFDIIKKAIIDMSAGSGKIGFKVCLDVQKPFASEGFDPEKIVEAIGEKPERLKKDLE